MGPEQWMKKMHDGASESCYLPSPLPPLTQLKEKPLKKTRCISLKNQAKGRQKKTHPALTKAKTKRQMSAHDRRICGSLIHTHSLPVLIIPLAVNDNRLAGETLLNP